MKLKASQFGKYTKQDGTIGVYRKVNGDFDSGLLTENQV